MGDEGRVRVRQNLSWRRANNEVVILDLQASEYLALNSTGAYLWERLAESGANAEELVDSVVREFDVTRDRARPDVEAFLESCRRQNLVQDAHFDTNS